MDLVEEDILMHYGVKRRSGRYPWGSGDNPYQLALKSFSGSAKLKNRLLMNFIFRRLTCGCRFA